MIVHGSFYKLPEILMSYEDRDGVYESNIVHLLASSIVLELNSRNINNPLNYIQVEKRYKATENLRCDIFCDFSSIVNESFLKPYSLTTKNWIEVKYYGSLNRASGSETKTDSVGKFLNDFYRLITRVQSTSYCTKFVLAIFNDNPQKYLAFTYQNKHEREWLFSIFETGATKSVVKLCNEPESVYKHIEDSGVKEIELYTRTTKFEPHKEKLGFWGYLIQVEDGSTVRT